MINLLYKDSLHLMESSLTSNPSLNRNLTSIHTPDGYFC